MRWALLLHSVEPGEGEIPEDVVAAMQAAFADYGKALEAAGVLVAAEVLSSTSASSTLTLRDGHVEIQDGPFADTKEALAGVFIVDVPDRDAALAWAEKCPGAQYGTLEVRPAATSFVDGSWT